MAISDYIEHTAAMAYAEVFREATSRPDNFAGMPQTDLAVMKDGDATAIGLGRLDSVFGNGGDLYGDERRA